MVHRYLYVKNGDVVAQMERIASVWPQPISSGPDAFLYDLVSQNIQSAILLLARAQRSAQYKYQNITAYVFPERYGRLGKVPGRIMAFFRVLVRAIRYRPTRIVCGTTGEPLWASFLASRILSVPLVHSRHNRVSFEGDSWHRRIEIAIDAFFVRRADGVICHGPYLKHELETLGVSEQKLLEFDVSFSGMRSRLESTSVVLPSWANDRFLLYTGRIEKNKGVFDLLDACTEFLLEDGALKLVIAGDGRYLDELKQTVSEHDFAEQVLLLGRIPHDLLAPIIKRSIAVITPTHSDFPEGRCMAAMEALVMGVPVIAPSFGPFLYLVEHGRNGLLFQPGSAQQLRKCIRDMLNDERLYERLREGAAASGDELLEPPRSFADAVEQAFSAATGAANAGRAGEA